MNFRERMHSKYHLYFIFILRIFFYPVKINQCDSIENINIATIDSFSYFSRQQELIVDFNDRF